MFKKYILWSLAIGLFAFSCEDDRDLVTVTLGDAPVISSPAAGYSANFTEDNLADEFATIAWSAADFGYTAAITYTVETDVAGNSFADAETLGTTTGFSLPVSNGKMNNIMVAKGLPGGTFTNMEIRVRAKVSGLVDELVSAPVTVSASPVAVEIEYPKLNVPGGYQGWDPALESTVIYSVQQNDLYEGYLNFPDDNTEFKYALGSWDTNWGDTGADGSLDLGGDNILAAVGGFYKLNVDLAGLTHSYTRTDWGLIGDATPTSWDSDTDMVLDPATNIWSITIDLVGGKDIKFRANDGWDINFGDTGVDATLEYGGDNIRIQETGNYTITLDLTKAVYTYTVTKN